MKMIYLFNFIMGMMLVSISASSQTLAGHWLGERTDAYIRQAHIGSIQGNLYITTNIEDKITSLIFVPADETGPIYIDNQSSDILLNGVSKSLKLGKIDIFSVENSITLIAYKNDFKVIIKILKKDKNKNLIIVTINKV